MNSYFSVCVLIICLTIWVLSPASQAYPISELSIIPSGSLAPSTSVTATFQIDIPQSGIATFPEGNTLQFITDLDNANWTSWIILNGRGNLQPVIHGRILQLSSWELTYHKNVALESVRVLLQGDAPQVTATQNKIIFDILELDPNFNIVPNSEIQKTALIVNPSDITNGIASLNNDLQSLRAEITNKTAIGADTSKAEEQYHEVEQEIKAAQVFPVSGYSNAMNHLVEAKSLIGVGLKYTDESWALKMVSDATVPLDAADKLIIGLQENKSAGDETRLTEIISQRESVANLIKVARGEIANGNYEQARAIAIRARDEGNNTFSNAFYLEKINDEQSFILSCLLIIAVICFMAGSIVMIVKYRKKKQEQKKEVPKS
jgi:hypothetical protein